MKRAALITALGAVGLSAALGIFALLGGEFGQTQGKVLGTSMLVTVTAIVALAAAAALEDGHLGKIPYAGIAAAVAGFGMLIAGMWSEFDNSAYLKTAMTLVIVSLAIGHMGLVGMARLPRDRLWAIWTTYFLAAASGLLIIVAMWSETDSETYWRFAGIVFILFAAATVTVPILHRMAGIPADRQSDLVPVTHCPFCGARTAGEESIPIVCGSCGRRWRAEIV